MPTDTISNQHPIQDEFQTDQVLPIAGAHMVHDIYTAFVAPLLPELINKLSLSLTQAGSLTAIMQIPAVLNPFIGYLADKVSLRYFVILAPGITATLISSMGFASNYLILAMILFTAGVSVAAFHAPAPAMIGRISGRQIGKGMSWFMAAGELARAIGPLLAVWAVSIWTLDGFFRVVVLGWVTSLVLYFRLRDVPARMGKPKSMSAILPVFRSLFLPLAAFILFRNFMIVSLTTFLPTFLSSEGASLLIAGGSLSILEIAGVAGALLSGTISDRIGRKVVLLIATVVSSILTLIFLNVQGWLLIPVLLTLGFFALSAGPVMLAMVQDYLPENRAVGNGLFMVTSFLIRAAAMFTVGLMGDRIGLRPAYYVSALVSLLAIPAIYALPSQPSRTE